MVSQETYTYVLLILALIRFLGCVLFLDFYISYRKNRLLYFAVGSFLFTLNPLIQLFLPDVAGIQSEANSFFTFNELAFLFSEILTEFSIFIFVLL